MLLYIASENELSLLLIKQIKSTINTPIERGVKRENG